MMEGSGGQVEKRGARKEWEGKKGRKKRERKKSRPLCLSLSSPPFLGPSFGDEDRLVRASV